MNLSPLDIKAPLEVEAEESVIEFTKWDKELNALLNRTVSETSAKVLEAVCKTLPATIAALVAKEVSNQLSVGDFFDDNKDLIAHKQVVKEVYQELSSANPGKECFEVLGEMVALEVRKRLGLAIPAVSLRTPKKKPSFINRRP